MAPGGIAFAASQFVFAGYSGAPFSNRAFNLRLRAACRALGVGEITAHGLRHSAATILLNQVGKDLREIQELSATRISARQCAIPMSAMNKHGRLRKHSARRWSEVGNASSGVLLTGEIGVKTRKCHNCPVRQTPTGHSRRRVWDSRRLSSRRTHVGGAGSSSLQGEKHRLVRPSDVSPHTQTVPARSLIAFVQRSLSLAAFERFENRVQIELRSTRGP